MSNIGQGISCQISVINRVVSKRGISCQISVSNRAVSFLIIAERLQTSCQRQAVYLSYMQILIEPFIIILHTKLSKRTFSNMEEVDNYATYNGSENEIKLSTTMSAKFICDYNMVRVFFLSQHP